MDELFTFVSVIFPDDPNVEGMSYWYLCEFEDVKVGDKVIAPLGRHNNTQQGVVIQVRQSTQYDSPFPMYLIKSIKKIIKT